MYVRQSLDPDEILRIYWPCIQIVFFDGQAVPNTPTHWHIGNMFQGMTQAYPFTLNHCQSFYAIGSLGNRNRSSFASPPICLALTREVHAVFMPVWDGFKLFSYQKAHSDILFERHRKPQISQPQFNHMSWFRRPESDLLPQRAVTVKEWHGLSSWTTGTADKQSARHFTTRLWSRTNISRHFHLT